MRKLLSVQRVRISLHTEVRLMMGSAKLMGGLKATSSWGHGVALGMVLEIGCQIMSIRDGSIMVQLKWRIRNLCVDESMRLQLIS